METAIEKRDNGELNDWETQFVSDLEDRFGADKKKLRNLTSAQFKKLRDIAS